MIPSQIWKICCKTTSLNAATIYVAVKTIAVETMSTLLLILSTLLLILSTLPSRHWLRAVETTTTKSETPIAVKISPVVDAEKVTKFQPLKCPPGLVVWWLLCLTARACRLIHLWTDAFWSVSSKSSCFMYYSLAIFSRSRDSRLFVNRHVSSPQYTNDSGRCGYLAATFAVGQ